MSSAPKRLHEESGSNEFHPLPFEPPPPPPSQDVRLSKLPRTESRSPLHHHHHMYRMPPPPPSDPSILPNSDLQDPPPKSEKDITHFNWKDQQHRSPIEDAHEAVGENKLDFRKKNWGERDNRRTNLQLGNSSSVELPKEERESERWERDRKDKDKDRPKSGLEKDNENETPARIPLQENPSLEPRRQKESDSWRAADKDRRKERDVELHEKRTRCYDDAFTDGDGDGDGATEREKEGFSCGVQQRKRMLRPRGSPQVPNREPRFRSRSRDYEESQEKLEVSSVVYKVGECMEELIKLRKEFEASQDNKNDASSLNCPTLEIRIPAEFVTATNRQVRGGQLWGTDIYTDDSDLVAVLMHTGYCRPTASPPPSAIKELRATIRMLPPQDCYTSTLRNNVRSRAWGAAIGCSYRVERCCIVKIQQILLEL